MAKILLVEDNEMNRDLLSRRTMPPATSRPWGSFFEMPHPLMEKRTPDEAQFRDKREWVERLLRPVADVVETGAVP